MKETPSNRPIRPENLAAALKRNMARRKGVVRAQGSSVGEARAEETAAQLATGGDA